MRRRAVGVVGVLICTACGGGSSSGVGSHIDTSSAGSAAQGGDATSLNLAAGTGGGGAGGTSNTGGSFANGGSGLNLAGSGPVGPTDITLHQCPATPEPSCPAKVLTGDYNIGGAAALTGVTEITGALTIRETDELNALSCLQTVGDDVTIDLFGSGPSRSLWPLRNLKKIGGGIQINTGFSEVWVDCGLSQLEDLGAAYLTGGAVDASDVFGHLNLSAIKQVTHIRIKNTNLNQITLPSSVSLTMGQLWFDSNPLLTTVDGFKNIALKQSGIVISGAQSVRIVNNPKLSNCRANEFKAAFVSAGFSAASMVLQGNLPDCN